MYKPILFLFLFVIISGCKKDIQPVDVDVPEEKSTSDFRSAFTGDFLVNYYEKSTYQTTTQDSLNVTYTLHADYSINDSVVYVVSFDGINVLRSSYPKLSLFLNGSFLLGFGIEPGGAATLDHFDPNAGAHIITQNGGFITVDSINYTYNDNSPHTSKTIKVIGHRI